MLARILCFLSGGHRPVATLMRRTDGGVRTVLRCATCGALLQA
jgi:hypothetical protein